MIIVFSIILFLLGLLAAENLITLKAPFFRSFLTSLARYQEALGVAGIVFGVVYFVRVLDMLPLLGIVPGHVLLSALSVVLMIGLGLVFGLEVIRRNVKDTQSLLFQKLEQFRIFSLRYQKPFGVAAVVIGLLMFFAYL